MMPKIIKNSIHDRVLPVASAPDQASMLHENSEDHYT